MPNMSSRFPNSVNLPGEAPGKLKQKIETSNEVKKQAQKQSTSVEGPQNSHSHISKLPTGHAKNELGFCDDLPTGIKGSPPANAEISKGTKPGKNAHGIPGKLPEGITPEQGQKPGKLPEGITPEQGQKPGKNAHGIPGKLPEGITPEAGKKPWKPSQSIELPEEGIRRSKQMFQNMEPKEMPFVGGHVFHSDPSK